jgi:hypothetical protein
MHGAAWLLTERRDERGLEPGQVRVRTVEEREQLLSLVCWAQPTPPPMLPSTANGNGRPAERDGRTYGLCSQRPGAEPCPRLATHKALQTSRSRCMARNWRTRSSSVMSSAWRIASARVMVKAPDRSAALARALFPDHSTVASRPTPAASASSAGMTTAQSTCRRACTPASFPRPPRARRRPRFRRSTPRRSRATRAGGLPAAGTRLDQRPFRAPHHTASAAALVGNARLRSGEITLAQPRQLGSCIESEYDLVRFLVAPVGEPAPLAHDTKPALRQHTNRRGVVARGASVKRTGCLQLQELL